MKKLIFLLATLLAIGCSKDELSPEQTKSFVKFLGPNTVNQSFDVKVLPNGNYALLGSTTTANSSTDLLLIVTDMFGNQLWQNQFGSTNNDWGTSLQVLPTGELLALGTTTDSVTQKTNMLIVKVSNTGSLVWQKSLGTAKNDEGLYLHIATDGNYLLVGTTDSIKNNTVKGGFIINVNTEGNILKTSTQGYLGDKLQYVVETSNFYYIGGTSYLSRQQLKGNSDVFILTVRKDLPSTATQKLLSVDGAEELTSMALLSDGSFIISGKTLKANTSNTDVFLMQTDKTLSNTPKWFQTYGDGFTDYTSAMLLNTDSTIMLVGTKGISESTSNIWLLKTNILGNKIWDKLYGATGVQKGTAIATAPNSEKGYVLTGINEYGNNTTITLIKVKENGNL